MAQCKSGGKNFKRDYAKEKLRADSKMVARGRKQKASLL
jgi:hypothetical protein